MELYVRELDAGAAEPKLKRKAMSMIKKLLSTKECTIKEIKSYYKICRLRTNILKE